MPIVLINMLPGRNGKTKKALLKNVTAAVTSTLDVTPEAVRVIIHEIPFAHYGIAGLPADKYRNRKAGESKKNVRKILAK
jgi:4-oxalocrotonate tautomerase